MSPDFLSEHATNLAVLGISFALGAAWSRASRALREVRELREKLGTQQARCVAGEDLIPGAVYGVICPCGKFHNLEQGTKVECQCGANYRLLGKGIRWEHGPGYGGQLPAAYWEAPGA